MASAWQQEYYLGMPWYEIRTYERATAPDPLLPDIRPGRLVQTEALEFPSKKDAIAAGMRRYLAFKRDGLVAVYDSQNVMIYPERGPNS